MIHRKKEEHDDRLRKFLARIHNKRQMLRVERCKFGIAKTTWSKETYGGDKTRTNPEKARSTLERIRARTQGRNQDGWDGHSVAMKLHKKKNCPDIVKEVANVCSGAGKEMIDFYSKNYLSSLSWQLG